MHPDLQDLRCHWTGKGVMHQQNRVFLLYVIPNFGVSLDQSQLMISLVLASSNVLMDIWILVLPIKTIMHIRRPKREKYVLYAVFGAGVFSCISG